MDINKKKPRVINLRKGKKIIPAEVPIIAVETPKVESVTTYAWIGGTFPCVDCGAQEAIELGRCKPCDDKHREKAAQLDARPRQVLERIRPKLTYRKEVVGGVVVTVGTHEPLRL